MSSSKSKSGNKRLKDRLSAMKEFIVGPAENEPPPLPEGQIDEKLSNAPPVDNEDAEGVMPEREEPLDSEQPAELSVNTEGEDLPKPSEASDPETPQNPANQHDERKMTEQARVDVERLVESLRTAQSASERVSAVRELGRSMSQRATPHLVAAMFDDDPDVRLAAEEAIALIESSEQSLDQLTPETAAVDARIGKSESGKISPGATEAQPDDAKARAMNGMAHLHLEANASELGEVAAPRPELLSPIASDDAATEEEQRLVEEHQTAREKFKELHDQIFKVGGARKGQRKQALWRAEREATLRAEAAERIRNEEELRKRAEKETELRRRQELATIETERSARIEAEAEAHRLAEEESRLRLQAADVGHAAVELFDRHVAMVFGRKAAEQAALKLEADRARAEAEQLQHAELEQLRQEEETLQAAIAEAARRRTAVEAAREDAEKDAVALLEAQERMRTAEEMRASAEAARAKLEAELLDRVENEERLLEEARQRAEAEHQRLAEENRLHLESVERELAEQKSAAERMRAEAEQRNEAEVQRLRKEEEDLNAAAEQVVRRRAEVKSAREAADRDTQRLLEAQNRMREAEEARAKVEQERAQLEGELLGRVEQAERLLEEARHRSLAEQQRLEDEARLQKESDEKRMAELERSRREAALHQQQLAAREKQATSELDSLRIADAEVRKRIAEAEAKKSTAEQAYRVVAEQLQRLEAEAHTRAAETEQLAARFEKEKRNAISAAQEWTERQTKIREEIETLRRREEEDSKRLKALAIQRADLEAELEKKAELVAAEEKALLKAQQETERLESSQGATEDSEPSDAAEIEATGKDVPASVGSAPSAALDVPSSTFEATATQISEGISAYLHSVDPYKRAAALSELAHSKADNAFELIVASFDDPAPQVRNAAALALRALDPLRPIDMFNRALEEASADRRRNIGAAIAESQLASEAVNKLASENREDTYNALSILFVMAKTGEVKPLIQAIEEHENDEVRRAVIKLLTLSGHSAAGDAALQRRVLGVAANRQKTQGEQPETTSEMRSKLADAEVKRVANGTRNDQTKNGE